MNRARFALIGFCLAVVACGARDPQTGGSRLRVAVDVPAALASCRYAPTERFVVPQFGEARRRRTPEIGERSIDIGLGERATAEIGDTLGEVFVLSQADPDLIAHPRIAAAQAERERGGVRATITYGVMFTTTKGEPIAEVTASGTGEFGYPLLVNLARLVLHLGTLFLFDSVDMNYVYGQAFDRAGEEAAKGLRDALHGAPELRDYARALRTGRQPAARDADIDRVLDTVLAHRPETVAVLDFEPIADAPTVVEAYLAEEVRTRLARKGVQTLERAALVHALDELQLNMTDLVDPTHAQRFGRLVAADAILTGTTAQFPHEMKLSLRLLATESGRVIGAGATRLSTYGAFPTADGRPRTASMSPPCPAPAGNIWVGAPPEPTPPARRWRPY